MSALNNNQLNENHGIAATGLQQPHTAVPPTTYTDKAGSNNPSETNRHAGTGIPPVNTAAHVQHNLNQEHNTAPLDETGARIGRNAYPPTVESTKFDEAQAVTGSHPTTSTGPEVITETSKHHPVPETGKHPVTSTGPEVHSGNVIDDKKVHHQTPSATGQHPTSSDGVEATKPSVGDKIKGNLEKVAGKITGNEEKVIKGENLAHGRA